jgi:hypothetical protein
MSLDYCNTDTELSNIDDKYCSIMDYSSEYNKKLKRHLKLREKIMNIKHKEDSTSEKVNDSYFFYMFSTLSFIIVILVGNKIIRKKLY